MRLWTIQALEVLEIIKQKGEFVCNPVYSDSDFKRAYYWLVKQMDSHGIKQTGRTRSQISNRKISVTKERI